MPSLLRSLFFCLACTTALHAETRLFLAKHTPDTPLEPVEATVSVGENVTIVFPTRSGSLWMKNDAVVPGATGRTLVIPAARLEDAGTYYVLYEGAQLIDSQELILKVAPEKPAVPSPRFLAFTSRGIAGSGQHALVSGFVIDDVPGNPDATKQVLIRAIGPTLNEFGVTGALAAPQLTVYDKTGKPVADVVSDRVALRAAEESTGAYPLLPGRGDAAQLLRLAPGVYTAQVTGSDRSTGIVLLEVYELPE